MSLRWTLPLLLALGCVRQLPLRTSSAERVPPQQSAFQVPAALEAVERALEAATRSEGMTLAQKVPVSTGGTVWVYKGQRGGLLSVNASSYVTTFESHVVGSWLAARLTPSADGTSVVLLAKPTLDGTEVCSDADGSLSDVKYWCVDAQIREDAQHRDQFNGQAEAELVTRLGEGLRRALGAARPQPAGTHEL